MIFVCDLDGTVADNSHRNHLIEGEHRDWESYYHWMNIEQDKPIYEAQYVLPKILRRNPVFFFLTGRPEKTRYITTKWLKEHFKIDVIDPNKVKECEESDIQLIMRPDGDHRKAVTYKEEFLKWLQIHPKLRSMKRFFFDDDRRNWEMYWRYGIPLHAPECWKCMIGTI